MLKRPSGRGCFTLIELLMVIAIIGMLSSIIVGSLNYARLRARDTKRIVELQNIQTAAQLYFETNAKYPESINGNTNSLMFPPGGQSRYMNEPKDPDGTSSYYYKAYKKINSVLDIDECGASGKCLFYHIGTNLELDGNLNIVLNSDADRIGSVIDGADNGGCTLDAKESKRYCYDVVSQ